MKVGAVILELEEYNRGQLRADKTIKFYNQRLAPFSEHVGSGTIISEVGRDEVRSFMASLRDKYSPETVRATAVCVKRLFSWAKDEGIIAENPISNLTLPRTPRVDRPALTREEVNLLLDKGFRNSRAGHRWGTMLLLAIDTGLRVSELCALKLKDVKDDGRITVKQGKGARDRVVFGGKRAIQRTLDYIHQYRYKPAYRSRSYIWIGNNGLPTRSSSFRKALYHAGDRVGIKVNPHQLRRTFATMMLTNKADLFTLQELMGHADIATTRKYIPRDLDRLREVHRTASPGDML
jgi:site-specific recombinase XerD